ncbi:aspartate/glutamate racemase family protein [Nakamurella deserti]|uniref:aspartate/glutamate racemase family protein n=1 Tax=Nakamurella deserti TaxID=2164074 RepID=UPI000DBE4B8F|nr:aspartate/glutamate racemase family protein [Nakamurella deserti]
MSTGAHTTGTAPTPDRQFTVALIHATPAAMAPGQAAFADRFPEATVWNLLDDLLITQANDAGGVTEPLAGRMRTLINHAIAGGADGVLLSCSMYGPVTGTVTPVPAIPVLGSDEALFAAVTDLRPAHVTVLGPMQTPVNDTVERLRSYLRSRGLTPEISGAVVAGAVQATTAGDREGLEAAVVAAARAAEDGTDVIVLGQFSLAPAAAATAAAVRIPVLSPPQLAADVLRSQLLKSGVTQ